MIPFSNKGFETFYIIFRLKGYMIVKSSGLISSLAFEIIMDYIQTHFYSLKEVIEYGDYWFGNHKLEKDILNIIRLLNPIYASDGYVKQIFYASYICISILITLNLFWNHTVAIFSKYIFFDLFKKKKKILD